jgi:endonuclease/exonuclease/phosphatase family metal-dependent hydrolase
MILIQLLRKSLYSLLLAFPVLFTIAASTAQNHVPVCVAFYNVENLFDTINQSGNYDLEYTPEGTNKWNSRLYIEKLDRIAEVISKIGQDYTPDGPAIIGLSEIENRYVLEDLVKQQRIKDRDYRVVFIRGRDRRVNNAFLYNPKYFELTQYTNKEVRTDDPSFRTRDHIIMSGKLLGEPMHFIVCHWPSRRGGEKRSLPLRVAAATAARVAIDSLKSLDPQAKIIIMGDFNDDPRDASVVKYLNSGGDQKRLKEGQLFNPFMAIHKKGVGSLAYRDSWNLFDQILVSQSLLGSDLSTFKFNRAEVFNKPFLRTPSGRFKDYPHRTHAGGVYLGGYSDHFPTFVLLLREVK